MTDLKYTTMPRDHFLDLVFCGLQTQRADVYGLEIYQAILDDIGEAYVILGHVGEAVILPIASR